MERIQKLSFVLLVIFNFLLVAIPLATCLTWGLLETSYVKDLITRGILLDPVKTPEGVINLAQVQWTYTSKLLAFVASMIGALPVILSLLSLKVIFKNYSVGDIFSVTNAQQYRFLGSLFFVYAFVTKPLNEMLSVLAVTLTNPPGHRYLTLSFGTPNIEVIFCGVLVMVISWVMLEGSKINEENRFTV